MSDLPQDAKGIFLAALAVADPAERAALVRRLCGDDGALLQRVDDLLRAYGQSNGPLDKLAAALAPTQAGQPIREQVGSTIGPYKLMEQIGEGGFGLVFVAEQQQPIRRKVALKIIKPGMDTRDVIARFEAERQALALMDHPNIARVLDAGTTESGRPYFVMELVRGVPITDYCDQSQLTPAERLPLFIDICNAVQHAHQKGIIHRDIKPSNVLVTLHDDRPVVKVIDFGVAKALHQPLTDRTIYTRFAQMIGTPLYMSPEQAQMSGLDIDTRSDIYSLGVLFYELLTGTTPLDKRRLAQAAYDELLKIIREEEPPKPSLRLSQSGDALPSIAAQRKTEPAKLSKMFSGDLDWITMKALEKDRTRRYETANAFAADLLRYLNDEPVEASPPSAAYRIRKFTRKHRGPVMALASIVAILVLGVAGTTWGLFRAQQAERVADLSKQQVVNALAETTKERDAKEQALAKEAAQRDQAERELAKGLLRPIGFGSGSRNTFANPAELRSIVDWSAIKDSGLKMRVLEIAFDDPETALRVARQSEQVIQAAVGLSRRRRTRAIEFVSARQRDRTADPKIRIGAGWLALELGLTELPAWSESCIYLGGKVPDRFGEFVDFATSRNNPRQIAHLVPDSLMQLLETSSDASVRKKSFDTLVECAPLLNSGQAARVLHIVVAKSAKGQEPLFSAFGSRNMLSLVARLEPKQLNGTMTEMLQLVDQFVAQDREYSELEVISATLGELATRLDQAQVGHFADAIISRLEKLCDAKASYVASHENDLELLERLKPIASHLTLAQAQHIGEILTTVTARQSTAMLSPASDGYASIVPRLKDADVSRFVDALIAALPAPPAFNEMATLAPRMQPAQAARAWEVVIKLVNSPPRQFSPTAESTDPAPAVLQALAHRLPPATIKEEEKATIASLETSSESRAIGCSLVSLITLTPRLESLQANRAANALIHLFRTSGPDELIEAKLWALDTLIPRLDPAVAKHAWQTLLEVQDWFPGTHGGWETPQYLVAIAPRLEARDIQEAADELLAALKRPYQIAKYSGLLAGLSALAPRLTSEEAELAIGVLMEAPLQDGFGGGLDFNETTRPAVSAYPVEARAKVQD